MSATVTARHRVALAGFVCDAITKKAVAGAVVSMTANVPPAFKGRLKLYEAQFGVAWNAMTERRDRTRSRMDGLFYFLDLPEGDYELNISAPALGKRFGSVTQTAKVARDAKQNYHLEWAEVSLTPTTIEGSITCKKVNIGFAQVRVQGSGESAFSNEDGRYTISGVEPGKRTLLIYAQGHKPATQPVTIKKPGDLRTVDIKLIDNAS
jgi:hypothetical protein